MTTTHPLTKATILFLAGIVCGAVTIGAAHVLVAVATWVWDLIGPWSLVLSALCLAWVATGEKRRAS